ncbi:MAG TPA: FixH family protein [Methylomirabilota bacterium]|nr:FixH family protein [Methylomirabilota bacterium]
MKRAWLVAAAIGAACSAPGTASFNAEISCKAEAQRLRQRCSVVLTDRATGRPVDGAAIRLHADMPSMPLSHHVPPVDARPVGRGTYQGTLELEMSGRWVISARLTRPVADQFTRVVDID